MRRSTKMITAGVAGVLAAVALLLLVLNLAGSGDVEVRLGDDEFRAGRTDSLAAAIERDGPIAFPDLLARDRPIFVQHTGAGLDRGWQAFAAVASGQPATCVLEWDAGAERFTDPCTDRTYPADGTGLTQYPTRIDGRLLYVDLRDRG